MRPIAKGAAPHIQYRPYAKALDDLVARIGPYCSYCEQPVRHAPEIEHVQPKSKVPSLQFSWNNFLLSCKSCNSNKGASAVVLSETAFPDLDNTFLGLAYCSGGFVTISPNLSPEQVTLMNNLVSLVKLLRHPSGKERPSARDKRADHRSDTWDIAQVQLGHYERFLGKAEVLSLLEEQIVIIASEKGFFSVWMTVFADHPQMCNRFISEFSGTARNCFDGDGKPVPRSNGKI
ncbi:HNH endonuclease [Shimia sp. R10_1]|uniref:HNH endonuclease n=1 Tax=Shimia sp. R10_1 TaxID=2821095 RepID=UPI001AD9A8B0|nr:HNH endonuclease [Shimia sp. R10_1]MBO9473378.1 HNH endonuclease [Shimia sp. R10_1]